MRLRLADRHCRILRHLRRISHGMLDSKGFGFIARENGEDVFVHFSAIEASGYRTLEEGARVSFVVKRGPKGLQAEQVNPE